MKKIMPILLFALFVPFLAMAQTGKHIGESNFLSYEIRYLSPLGETISGPGGIEYIYNGTTIERQNTVLPEKYFGSYPLYFSEGILNFEVVIRNEGKREYRNILVETQQELLNENGGEGEAMVSNYNFWRVESISSGEEMVLSGFFNIPRTEISGLDQTHLKISHQSAEKNRGEVILEDFQAGLWCPVSLE